MFSIDGVVLANKGFYVNLDSSVNRREHIENLILKHNIVGLERFSALKDELVQSSCTKSHLGIFKQALDEDLEIIFVGEDDFDIKEYCYAPYSDTPVSFNESILKISDDLKNVEWDVLLFGCNPKSHLIPITENLAKNYFSTGAWAYLIKKRAYKYILENSNYYRDYIAIDDYLPLLSKKGFVTLTTIPLTINHAIGFESTLQPRGPVNYDAWIQGSYGKFLYGNYMGKSFSSPSIEKQITIVITGHYVENYFFYLRYLLHSLPDELFKCRFIVHYDEGHGHDSSTEKVRLNAFFRDYEKNINLTLSYGYGGLISSLESVMEQVTTPYFIFLEHDWVFLKKDNIDFLNLMNAFNNHDFINAVWFAKDDNTMRGFEIARDVDDITTPFDREDRVNEVNLVTTCRWSNNPVMFRLSKLKEWYYNIIKNEHVGIVHQAQQNIEETIIPHYRNIISKNKWRDIRDDWGTFLYGALNEGPYVGHTDASKRYQGIAKSGPEYNGEEYIKNNPL